MLTAVDDRLRREVRAFRLRFACSACEHHDADADACSLGYPNEAHRSADLLGVRSLAFCKGFELG